MTDIRAALAQVLTDHGIAPNQNGFHGWRCEHPDRYPDYCHCVPDLLDALVAALAAASPEPHPAPGMPDPTRAALLALADATRTYLHVVYPSGTRHPADAIGADLERAHRAARAALASPEPERCEYRNKFGDPVCVLPPGHPNGHTSVQPAPAASTVEALRDALVKDAVAAYQVDAVGRFIYDPPTFRDRLIGLEAAARADERTRMDAPLAVDAGPEPRHMPVICCRWHAIAGQPR